jgi:hypothetical protein
VSDEMFCRKFQRKKLNPVTIHASYCPLISREFFLNFG